MERRQLLATLGTAATVSTAGCGLVQSPTVLSDPTQHSASPGRGSLSFTANGEEVGSLGVDGDVAAETITISTEISHRAGTTVRSIELRVWMPAPGSDTPADVAVVSPVEGDSSPPPAITLSSPQRGPGTIITVDDLDDLADETISTLNLMVRPHADNATTLMIDATIELANTAWLGGDYTLDGRLQLEFPDLGGQ